MNLFLFGIICISTSFRFLSFMDLLNIPGDIQSCNQAMKISSNITIVFVAHRYCCYLFIKYILKCIPYEREYLKVKRYLLWSLSISIPMQVNIKGCQTGKYCKGYIIVDLYEQLFFLKSMD